MTGKRVPNGTLVGLEVGGETLATYLGVTPNSISRLATEHGMPRSGRGTYPLKECVQWYLQRLKTRAIEHPDELREERRKLIVSQREAQELENARLRAEMLNADLVTSTLHHVVGLIGVRLDALPGKVVPQIAGLRDAAAISRVVSDAAYAVRREASRDIAQFAASLADDPAA